LIRAQASAATAGVGAGFEIVDDLILPCLSAPQMLALSLRQNLLQTGRTPPAKTQKTGIIWCEKISDLQ